MRMAGPQRLAAWGIRPARGAGLAVIQGGLR